MALLCLCLVDFALLTFSLPVDFQHLFCVFLLAGGFLKATWYIKSPRSQDRSHQELVTSKLQVVVQVLGRQLGTCMTLACGASIGPPLPGNSRDKGWADA